MVRVNASSHCSSCARLRPAQSARTAMCNSPRMIGSTTRSLSFRRVNYFYYFVIGCWLCRLAQHIRIDKKSHPRWGASTSSLARSARRFEPAFDRTGQQQLYEPFVRAGRKAHQPIFAAVDASILSSCPGSIPSRCRISAGRTIGPWWKPWISYQVRYYLTQGTSTVFSMARAGWISYTTRLLQGRAAANNAFWSGHQPREDPALGR